MEMSKNQSVFTLTLQAGCFRGVLSGTSARSALDHAEGNGSSLETFEYQAPSILFH